MSITAKSNTAVSHQIGASVSSKHVENACFHSQHEERRAV